MSYSDHKAVRRVIEAANWGLRGASGVWAAAWSAFVGATAWSGESWRELIIAIGFVGAVWTPTLIAWRWPRTGGAVLGALGVWSFGAFDSRSAMVGLAVPAMLLGGAFLALGGAGAVERAWARWRSARE